MGFGSDEKILSVATPAAIGATTPEDVSAQIIAEAPSTAPVTSVFGRTGAITAQSGDYTKAHIGLSNVDNTSDLNKPISIAQQAALDAKQPIDEDLTALASLSSVGFAVRTATNTWAQRSLQAGQNITITDPFGISGNPVISGLPPAAYESSATNTVTTTSTTLSARPVTPITITPPEGNYIAIASLRCSNNNSAGGCRMQIRSAGSLVPHTLRQATNGGAHMSGSQHCLASSCKVTVNGSQAVEIYVASVSAGTASFYETSLTLHAVT